MFCFSKRVSIVRPKFRINYGPRHTERQYVLRGVPFDSKVMLLTHGDSMVFRVGDYFGRYLPSIVAGASVGGFHCQGEALWTPAGQTLSQAVADRDARQAEERERAAQLRKERNTGGTAREF